MNYLSIPRKNLSSSKSVTVVALFELIAASILKFFSFRMCAKSRRNVFLFFFYYECLNVDNMAIIEKIVVNIKKNKFSLLLSDFLSFFFFFFYSIFVLLHFYTAGCLWRSFLWLYYLVKQQPSLSSLLLLCEKMNFNEAELKKIFEKPKKVTNYLHSFRQFFIISMKKKHCSIVGKNEIY